MMDLNKRFDRKDRRSIFILEKFKRYLSTLQWYTRQARWRYECENKSDIKKSI